MSRYALFAFLLVWACASPPPPHVPPPVVPEPPAEQLFTFHLRDARADSALQALAAAAGQSLSLAPDARTIARCTQLTVVTPEAVPADALFSVTRDALEGTSLVLEQRDDGWFVRKTEGAIAKECLPAEEPAVAEPPAPVDAADIVSGIRTTGQDTYELPRSVLNSLLENQSSLMRSVRIVPEHKDGTILGIRVFGVRPDSVMEALGFRNGDRIESANGYSLASSEQALDAYVALRQVSKVEVKIVRGGVAKTLRYNIVEAP